MNCAVATVSCEATARTHVSNILGKLHLASRTQAVLYALREGLTSLDDAVTLGEADEGKDPSANS